jgi:hypothetical protein
VRAAEALARVADRRDLAVPRRVILADDLVVPVARDLARLDVDDHGAKDACAGGAGRGEAGGARSGRGSGRLLARAPPHLSSRPALRESTIARRINPSRSSSVNADTEADISVSKLGIGLRSLRALGGELES